MIKDLFRGYKMKIKKDYILRNVGDETVVVPTGEEAVNFNGMISLNDSGRLLFETLQKESTYEELINVMTNHYN
ncbi:PqqD family protein, partial [Methanocalculus natronophilus]|uniref:PqqD family protein n=1 Tax=Methanocalculus natronophilus TaxID=1262400 RepID=UPI0031B63920